MTSHHAGLALGVSSLGLPGGDLEELLDLAEAHGCRALELRASDGEPVHLGLDGAERAAVAKRCARRGMQVLAVASYVRICAPSDTPVLADLRDHLTLAADLGAGAVRVFPGGDGTAGAAQRAVRLLAEVAEDADRLGVRVLVETHDSHPRGADVARLLADPDLTGAPVGAIWDVVHPWVAGEEPSRTWMELAPVLAHVQIKDVAARTPGATPTLLGAGVLPLDEVVGTLTDGGYAGPLVLEWEKPWHAGIPDLATALAATTRWRSERDATQPARSTD